MELTPRVAKNIFSFKEVSAMTGVKPYVLRFWETEFAQIVSETDDKGNKFYPKASVDLINQIKSMLFDQKMSIQMVKARLGFVEAPVDSIIVSNTESIVRDESGISITYEKRSLNSQVNEVTYYAAVSNPNPKSLSPVKKELEDVLRKIEELERKYLALNN